MNCEHKDILQETIDTMVIEKCKHCRAFRRLGFWDRWHDSFTENISKWLDY